MAMFSLCLNIDSTTRLWPYAMTKNRLCRSLHLRLGGLLSRPFEMCSGSCPSFKIASISIVTAHGTAILTTRGPSELVAERIFYALQINMWQNLRKGTISRYSWIFILYLWNYSAQLWTSNFAWIFIYHPTTLATNLGPHPLPGAHTSIAFENHVYASLWKFTARDKRLPQASNVK